MGLSDVFGSPQKEPQPVDIAGAVLQSPGNVAEKAEDTAAAFDRVVAASTSYSRRREALIKEVDDQLTELRAELDEASETYNAKRDDLRASMEAAGVTKIPMNDRDPIEIKVKKGQKKNVTLRWLKEELGHDDAKSLWGKVPTYDDKTDLHMPAPYDDQPSD